MVHHLYTPLDAADRVVWKTTSVAWLGWTSYHVTDYGNIQYPLPPPPQDTSHLKAPFSTICEQLCQLDPARHPKSGKCSKKLLCYNKILHHSTNQMSVATLWFNMKTRRQNERWRCCTEIHRRSQPYVLVFAQWYFSQVKYNMYMCTQKINLVTKSLIKQSLSKKNTEIRMLAWESQDAGTQPSWTARSMDSMGEDVSGVKGWAWGTKAHTSGSWAKYMRTY